MAITKEPSYRIRGVVVDSQSRRGIEGLRIEAWDKDLVVDDLVGSAVSDAGGTFEITFSPRHFRELFLDRSPDLYFKVFRGSALVASTENAVLWNVRKGEIPVTIPVALPSPGAPIDRDRIVRGVLVLNDRRAPSRMRVSIVDKNVGGDVSIGETTTDEAGAYELTYGGLELKGGKARPDLQAKLVGDQGDVLAASAIRYDAGPEENDLDILLPPGTLPAEAEYARLTRDLGERLAAASGTALARQLRTLEENERRQDITYLANKTGWDARMVAMAALAHQYSDLSGVRPELLYALFRAGVPASDAALAALDANVVRQIWERSIEQQIIPPDLQAGIPENLQRFTAFGAGHLLEAPPQVGISGMKALLDLSLGPDAARQRRFIELLHERGDDLAGFWERVGAEFGTDTAERLRLDGQLARLTINNAALIAQLHGNQTLRTPADLVRQGLYRAESWAGILAAGVPIPPEIQGGDADERRHGYARLLANQLQLSYPTAVLAARVRREELRLPAEPQVRMAAAEFLDANQGRFELGLHPVEQYLRDNQLTLDAPVLQYVKALQRVGQISATDEVMARLIERRLDSAQAVVRYDEQEFVNAFQTELGGETAARLTYAKAHQVHHAVVNIATAYLIDRTAVRPRALSGGAPEGGDADGAGGRQHTATLASADLEALFGEMDYCDCDHCRSWLSPAAYLVDLLQFLDVRFEDAGKRITPGCGFDTPLDVLLHRRPDIQHLQLTCENTNTVLPSIDLVNEILEHYVVHDSIETFTGHDVPAHLTSEELLAAPQFVIDSAYDRLREARFPLRLPFHRSLETLRRYFAHASTATAPARGPAAARVGTTLAEALERLRPNDAIERAGAETDPPYGWRDILMERLGLSRAEYAILTDSRIPLAVLYGEEADDGVPLTNDDLVERLSNAGRFARRVGISYQDLIALVRTQFVNPHSHLIPKLEKLGLDFKAMHDGDFETRIPVEDLDMPQYGGRADASSEERVAHVAGWIRRHLDRIMALVVLSDPTGSADVCGFDTLELRHALPDFDSNRLRPIEWLKLVRFIRLWRTLGWSIEETDKAIAALYPADQRLDVGEDEATAGERLDAGFALLIERLAHLKAVMAALDVSPHKDLLPLLACWAPIDTHGERSLYRRMFLNPAAAALPAVFREDGHGNYLQGGERIGPHLEALGAAFSLTQAELAVVLEHLGFDGETRLTLDHVSRIFRSGWFARALRLSVRELVDLGAMAGLDAFAPLDLDRAVDPDAPPGAVRPPVIRLIEVVRLLQEAGIKVSQLLLFLQHQDDGGRALPTRDTVLGFARTIQGDLRRIEHEHAVSDDPTGEATRALMALAYGNAVADDFFGLLNGTSEVAVPYAHGARELDPDVIAVTDQLRYDDFQKRLIFRGVMTEGVRNDLGAAPSASDAFRDAVQGLHDAARALFVGLPDLGVLYDDVVASSDDLSERLSRMVEAVLPLVRDRMKRQHVRHAVSAHLAAPLSLAQTLLETVPLLHAWDRRDQPAMADLLALERWGVSVACFFGAEPEGAPDSEEIVDVLDYPARGHSLPANARDAAAPIAVVASCYLEAPDNGVYTFSVDADARDVMLAFDGAVRPLSFDGRGWETGGGIELEAGRLYPVTLTVRGVRDQLALRWASRGMARQTIPAAHLTPAAVVDRFAATYLRLSKAAAIVGRLDLLPGEIAHLAAHPDFRVGDESWLNALPVAPAPPSPPLLDPFVALLRYARIKRELDVGDDRLLAVLRQLEASPEEGIALLLQLTRWHASDLTRLLEQFSIGARDLGRPHHFLRVHEAFGLLRALGAGAGPLLSATTNEPLADRVHEPPVDPIGGLQAAVRARYDADAWLAAIQPINDELRRLQRDALVAYVLHRLQRHVQTRHIDTPERLFEFLLIDVGMAPCMRTSRIRQALSSVQLFVQRCLLNLEPCVPSSAIRGGQWEWMKQYRVWEANRKVFLFPENWLETALLDIKSPFLRELESELLQGDVTDRAAATALVHYLEKLDEVAKLEICGMYWEEGPGGNVADEVVHVVARTAGARRAYYYRRLEGITWTPWEKIQVNIEDNPVLPVVWKGRLFLFWAGVLQEAAESAPPRDTPALNFQSVTPSALMSVPGQPRVRVAATLYWSELYDGRWQPPRTSDVRRPLTVGEFPASGEGAFDRSHLRLRSSIGDDGRLLVHVECPGRFGGSFDLHGTHSLPVQRPAGLDSAGVLLYRRWFLRTRTFSTHDAPFTISYHEPLAVGGHSVKRPVLNRGDFYDVIQPGHPLRNIFHAPFFFQDPEHVFFVRSAEMPMLIRDIPEFGLGRRPSVVDAIDPPRLVQRPTLGGRFPGELIRAAVDLSALAEAMQRETYIREFLATPEPILYGDVFIAAGHAFRAEPPHR